MNAGAFIPVMLTLLEVMVELVACPVRLPIVKAAGTLSRVKE
jgi:hypothetical protein